MEVHAVVLDGRHAHVGAGRQAPGALLGRLVPLDLGARSHLAKARHVGVGALAELLGKPDGLADLSRGGLHLGRHLGQSLAAFLPLALGQGVHLGLCGGLLILDGRKHRLVRVGKILGIVDAHQLRSRLSAEQRRDLDRAILVRLDEFPVLARLAAVEPDDGR